MPIDLMVPSALKKPVTPTTALSLSSASVVAGSSRFTCPALSCSWSAAGIASRSTLRPTLNAVLQLHKAIAGERNGGTGHEVRRNAGFSVGCKVDLDAIPAAL